MAKKTTLERLMGRTGALLVVPALLVMTLVIVYPLGLNIYYSLHDIRLFRPEQGTPFVGLENYRRQLTDPLFLRLALNSVLWVAVTVAGQVLLGFSGALLAHRAFAGRGIFRGIMLIPWVIPGVVGAITWRWMYDGQFGIINTILTSVHLIDRPIAWLGNYDYAFGAVMLAYIWKTFPFCLVMILASLQTIPEELYEAARIDGASRRQEFRVITVPGVSATLGLTTLLTSIWGFNNFNFLWIMTGGGPAHASETLTIGVYLKAFQAFDLGNSSALATLTYFFLLIIVIIYSRRTDISEGNL